MPVDSSDLLNKVNAAVAAQNVVLTDQDDLANKNTSLSAASAAVGDAQTKLASDAAARDAAFTAAVDALNALKNPAPPPPAGVTDFRPVNPNGFRTVASFGAPASGSLGGVTNWVLAAVRSFIPGLSWAQAIHIVVIVAEDYFAKKSPQQILADVLAALGIQLPGA